ncbi:MAG: GTP-binding protein [Algoriphagus sp.]|jgi:GTP-binding protein
MSSNFIDYVKIHCQSGKGGAGSVHFRREKMVDKGGPDGGDGGRGGHVILRGNRNLWTLIHLRYKKHIRAGNGVRGSGSRSTGAQGKDMYIDVPMGTVIKDAETGALLAEITEDQQETVLYPGGMGGLGNTHFKSATKQTPDYAQPGQDGTDAWAVCELKVLADVGLVGFPNAGKSTLLSVVSAAKPEIANYAFTTLTPNLGVIPYHDYKSFVMADIPGIIEGAAEGKGLGLRFLRHIERNSILLFIVSAESENIKKEFKTLLNELKKFNPELLDKTRILGISKIDSQTPEELEKIKKKLPKDIPTVMFSSLNLTGIPELKDILWNNLS